MPPTAPHRSRVDMEQSRTGLVGHHLEDMTMPRDGNHRMLTPRCEIRRKDTLIVPWITSYMCHNQLHTRHLCMNHLWKLCM